MAVRTILEHPDPRLRAVCAAVEVFDDGLRALADDLVETLHATSGLGLSAPQVGDLRRVLAMDHSADASAPRLFVNPVITRRAAWGLVEESCLSVPGIVGNVVRATRVRVRAQALSGEPFERDLDGMPAVCMQHEIDHLDGKLFIDRLNPLRRLQLRLKGVGRQVTAA